MNKFFVIVLILGFWLVLPIPFLWMGVSGLDTSTMKTLVANMEAIQPPQTEGIVTTDSSSLYNAINDAYKAVISFLTNAGRFILLIFTVISLYFQVLILGIPGVHELINYFLLFMKIISVTTIYLLLRGN